MAKELSTNMNATLCQAHSKLLFSLFNDTLRRHGLNWSKVRTQMVLYNTPVMVSNQGIFSQDCSPTFILPTTNFEMISKTFVNTHLKLPYILIVLRIVLVWNWTIPTIVHRTMAFETMTRNQHRHPTKASSSQSGIQNTNSLPLWQVQKNRSPTLFQRLASCYWRRESCQGQRDVRRKTFW